MRASNLIDIPFESNSYKVHQYCIGPEKDNRNIFVCMCVMAGRVSMKRGEKVKIIWKPLILPPNGE